MKMVNYKAKYDQLKLRFQESVDVAFRLGYEQGALATQNQQMQQQAQQVADQQAQQAQMAASGMGGDPSQGGQPGQESGQPGQSGQESGQPGAQIQDDSRGVGQQTGAAGAPQGMGGSELDQRIGELEGLMAKSEYGTEQWETLNKSLASLKSIKVTLDLKKNEQLIKSIGANLKKPLIMSGRAKHNTPNHIKEAVSMQHKIVNELMDTWQKESEGLPTEIGAILRSEGLSKKE
jgi:hypothetical protein